MRPTACQWKAGSFHARSSTLGEELVHSSTNSEHPTWYSREGELSANDGVEHAPRSALTLLAFARRILLWSTSRISALAMHSSGHTMSKLGLVVLLQLVRLVEIHDDTVHDERLNRAGVERVHHSAAALDAADAPPLSLLAPLQARAGCGRGRQPSQRRDDDRAAAEGGGALVGACCGRPARS